MKFPSFSASVALGLLVVLTSPSQTAAQTIAPNPGGAIVVTNSTTSTFVNVDTPVSVRVDQYSTTITALLNGSSTVYSATFSAPFTDPTVQAAILAADGILSGKPASFSSPLLTFSSTLLTGSTTLTAVAGPVALDGTEVVTTVTTFGPNTIMVGDNKSDLFFIIPGQTDININTDLEYAIPRTVTTTNTYLTTQSYLISGASIVTPPPGLTAVPEPSTYGVGATLALASIVALRRRRVRNALA